jgi:galactose mutarotase-like enzyme
MTARLLTDWSYRGLDAVILENSLLRVSVLPALGAKVLEFIDKRTDRDLLYHHPRTEPRPPVFGANVDNWWSGGIDEAAPTGHPCTVDGEDLPFLGELWSLPWNVEREGSCAVRFTRDAIITPLRVARRMELRAGEPFVRVTHRLENLSDAQLPILWGLHPSFPIGPDTHIQIPARVGVFEEGGPAATTLPEHGSTYPWDDGSPQRLHTDPSGSWRLDYATELDAGWLAVWDAELATGFGLEFPPEVLKSVWVWLVDGGWRGLRCVAVEPWTGYPAQLDRAISEDRALILEPRAQITFETRLIAFSTTVPIAGFDADGLPKARSPDET